MVDGQTPLDEAQSDIVQRRRVRAVVFWSIVIMLGIAAFATVVAVVAAPDTEYTRAETPQTTAADSHSEDGQGDAGTDGDAGAVAAGEDVFAQTCTACHGGDAEGVQGLGKALVDSAFVEDTSDADLVVFIETGRDADDPDNTTGVAMPPKGGDASLTDEQVQEVTAYIKSLNE